MGDAEIRDEIRRIGEKVRCGYLRADYLLIHNDGEPFRKEDFHIECMSPECCEKMGCKIYDGKSCEYRSLQADDAVDKQPGWIPF